MFTSGRTPSHGGEECCFLLSPWTNCPVLPLEIKDHSWLWLYPAPQCSRVNSVKSVGPCAPLNNNNTYDNKYTNTHFNINCTPRGMDGVKVHTHTHAQIHTGACPRTLTHIYFQWNSVCIHLKKVGDETTELWLSYQWWLTMSACPISLVGDERFTLSGYGRRAPTRRVWEVEQRPVRCFINTMDTMAGQFPAAHQHTHKGKLRTHTHTQTYTQTRTHTRICTH
jgi:hypothetical protein